MILYTQDIPDAGPNMRVAPTPPPLCPCLPPLNMIIFPLG